MGVLGVKRRFDSGEPGAVERLAQDLRLLIRTHGLGRPVAIVCVGTDRATGDALGPLVGIRLRSRVRATVLGIPDQPVHRNNYEDVLRALDQGENRPFIIAVDAALGKPENVGKVLLMDAPLAPGAGVGLKLPAFGDVSIMGIVDADGFLPYLILKSTPLGRVIRMAEFIESGIRAALKGIRAPMLPPIHVESSQGAVASGR